MSEAERRWLLKAIREAGGEIESQFWALDDAATRWRPGDDDWCIVEISGHLRDIEAAYLERLRRMVDRRNPRLRKIDVEALPAERHYARQPLRPFLRELAASRSQTVELLWSLAPDDWERAGVHEYRGSITVVDVARDINRHDLQHLWQARRVVRAYEEARGLPAGSLLG